MKQNFLSLFLAVIFGFGAGLLANFINLTPDDKVASDQNHKQQIVIEENSAYINAIEEVGPSVVSIVATKDIEVFFTQPYSFFGPFGRFEDSELDSETITREIGGGTGFIVTENGLVVTNKHVVEDVEAEYSVFLNDGSKFYVEVLDTDPNNDIAVLQLYEDQEFNKKAQDLNPVKLGDSDSSKVGSRVLAIGNALSEFDNTSTVGIISAKNRQITATNQFGFNASTLRGLIQTDAAINPGNSGGPLVNIAGEVIGVNTAVAADANGISFAIPINDVKPIIESILEFGEVVRPFIGIRYIMINEQIAEELGLGQYEGAYLSDDVANRIPAVVPDSPADKAGLKTGDIIISINDEKINETNDIATVIREFMPGDRIRLAYVRDGIENEVELELNKFEELN